LEGVLDSVQAGIASASKEVEQRVLPHAVDLHVKTREQVEKLHQWEYLVDELASTASSGPELAARLQSLGDQRWDCFNIQTAGTALRITCKRRPATALSYFKCLAGG
jgi:hypothetical protein